MTRDSFPVDAHDARLIGHVRPPDWVNPPPRSRYQLVVIGAGTAGLVTAAGAAGLGASVALIERDLMGGDCLNVGCVPSKALIAAARAWSAANHASRDFHGPAATGSGDFGKVMERMRRLRADLAGHDGAARFRDLGVDVFFGSGTFTSPKTIEVAGRALHYRRAVIATGARAAAPPIPGLAEVPYLTNETVFSLTSLPPRLLVIGAGPIGCEMAQAFARFGSRVTVVARGAHILPRDDRDAAAIVQRQMTEDGVRFCLGSQILRVASHANEIVVTVRRSGAIEELVADRLLIATGRAPNVEELGLGAAGVAHTGDGVTVDDHFRTANRRVFAVGDVISSFQFTHAADFQARTVIQNALFFGRARQSNLVIPWATYTSPELAHVGHTAESARSAGLAVRSFEVQMQDVDRARLDGRSEGFARVHVEAGRDRILGATIVSEHAGEVISEVAMAMTNGLGLGAIGRTIHPYPTHSEVLRKVADSWRRTKLTPVVKLLLRRWFQIFACVVLAVGGAGRGAFAQSFDHSAFDRLLKAHVAQGLVDYDAFRASTVFPGYLAALAATDPAKFSRDEQLAFWINAYNAYTIQLIVAHRERKSIRNINKTLFLKLKGPWSEPLASVGGTRYTLDDIEHRIIRPRFKEPRIHFALVCAAMGCPPLRSEAYVADRLDSQLDAQGVVFLRASPEKNRVDLEGRVWHHSMIFEYYKEDFGGSVTMAAAFAARWYPDGPEKQLLLSGDLKTRQTHYDWTLNSQERAARVRTP